jgi:hypothetical protein
MSSWVNYLYSTAQSVGNSVVNWLNTNNIEVRVEYQEDGVRYRRVISGPNRHDNYIVERENLEGIDRTEFLVTDQNAVSLRVGGGGPLGAAALIASGQAFPGGDSSLRRQGAAMTDSMIEATCIVTEYVPKDQPEQCTICIDDYHSGDFVRVLPCFHKYHKTCIDEWLRPHGDCPVCKFSLV